MTQKLSAHAVFGAAHSALNVEVQWKAWKAVNETVWKDTGSTLSDAVYRSGPRSMSRAEAEAAWSDTRIDSSHPNFRLFLSEVRQSLGCAT